jgi:hypothetical protein
MSCPPAEGEASVHRSAVAQRWHEDIASAMRGNAAMSSGGAASNAAAAASRRRAARSEQAVVKAQR